MKKCEKTTHKYFLIFFVTDKRNNKCALFSSKCKTLHVVDLCTLLYSAFGHILYLVTFCICSQTGFIYSLPIFKYSEKGHPLHKVTFCMGSHFPLGQTPHRILLNAFEVVFTKKLQTDGHTYVRYCDIVTYRAAQIDDLICNFDAYSWILICIFCVL